MMGPNNKQPLHKDTILTKIYSQQSNISNYKLLYVNIVDIYIY